MKTLLVIFLGGGLGATMRHGFATFIYTISGPHFPFGIMTVNILGSFVMGLLLSIISHFWTAPLLWRSFLFIGILGGFTTFSSFTADTILLIERGDWPLALVYVLCSVILSLLFLVLGLQIPRFFATP